MHAIIPTRSTRETRNSQTGKLGLPFCRTTKFKNSFLPSSLNLWNNLKIDTRQMESLNKLKKFLNSKFEVDDRFLNYNLISGPYTRILTQMRLGLGPLQGHLFQYNLTDNPFCQNCLTEIESSTHFLFKCGKFAVPMDIFWGKLSCKLSNIDMYKKEELANICLNGKSDFDYIINCYIMHATASYIGATERFKSWLQKGLTGCWHVTWHDSCYCYMFILNGVGKSVCDGPGLCTWAYWWSTGCLAHVKKNV